MYRKLLPAIAIGVLSAAASAPTHAVFTAEASASRHWADRDERFEELTASHGVTSAGAAIIRNGEIVWTGYSGEQAPGIPTSRDTMFNVASITKTATAEAVLRLADSGR